MKSAALRAAWLGALFVILAGGAWWLVTRPAPWEQRPPAAPDSARAGVRAVALYFAAADGDSLVREERELVEPDTFRERVVALVAELDRGPRGRGVAALPAGTSVLRVYFDEQGLLTLDLSGSFRRGFRGGATAEYLAIASLVRTLAANLPEVRRVHIVCASRPLASLGGHLPLDRPLDVADWP